MEIFLLASSAGSPCRGLLQRAMHAVQNQQAFGAYTAFSLLLLTLLMQGISAANLEGLGQPLVILGNCIASQGCSACSASLGYSSSAASSAVCQLHMLVM